MFLLHLLIRAFLHLLRYLRRQEKLGLETGLPSPLLKPNDALPEQTNTSVGSTALTSDFSTFPSSEPSTPSTQKRMEISSAPPPASIDKKWASGGRIIPAPTKPSWYQQFVIRTYPNDGQEVIDTTEGIRKITYGLHFEGKRKLTFDAHETIWMNREGKVIAVRTYDGLMRRCEGGELCNKLPVDMVSLEELMCEGYFHKNNKGSS
jgi:hypothetical protein